MNLSSYAALTNVAEGAGVAGLVAAVALELLLAGPVQAARHDEALVARHALPAHRARAHVGAHALAVGGAGLDLVLRAGAGGLEGADGRAAEVLGLRPSGEADHLVVVGADVVIGLLESER